MCLGLGRLNKKYPIKLHGARAKPGLPAKRSCCSQPASGYGSTSPAHRSKSIIYLATLIFSLQSIGIAPWRHSINVDKI